MEYLKLILKGQIPSLKNDRVNVGIGGKGTGIPARMITVPSGHYKKWYVSAREQIHNQCVVDYLFRHVEIKYTLYYRIKGRIDLTNSIQSIEDLMTDCMVIEDDRYRVISKYSASAHYNKVKAGAEILIHNLDFNR